MAYQCRMFEDTDYQRVLDFYKQADGEYYPLLSEREGGLEGHMQRILQSGGSFALFEVDNELQGAAGFFPIESSKEVVQFTFFTFAQKYRNGLAPYRLARYLAEMKDELGYQATKKLIARTFYESSADRMERMGFNHVATIKGDIIPDRTSYYFEGDLDFVVGNVMKGRTVKRHDS